jgi:hypothetical protein
MAKKEPDNKAEKQTLLQMFSHHWDDDDVPCHLYMQGYYFVSKLCLTVAAVSGLGGVVTLFMAGPYPLWFSLAFGSLLASGICFIGSTPFGGLIVGLSVILISMLGGATCYYGSQSRTDSATQATFGAAPTHPMGK